MDMGKGDVPPTAGAGRNSFLAGRIGKAAIAALTAITLLTSAPVAADPASPDELEILSVYVAKGLYREDDYLLVFHYNISYAVPPSTPVNDLFHFRLLDTDGETVIGAANIYPYNSGGYYEGAGALYFGPEVAPTWDEPLVLQIRGNPEYWSSPPTINYTLAISDYSPHDLPWDNHDVMGAYIIDVAMSLEIDWDVIMLTESELGTVLSTTGETYFRGTIKGLHLFVPELLAVTTTDPDYTPSDYGTDRADEYVSRWEDTWMESAMDGIRDLGFEPTLITGMVTLLLIGLMFAISHSIWGTTDPAFNAGIIVFFMSYLMGFMAPAVMALVTVFAGIYIVYIWMFRHG
jgi:hypothetical protein